MYNLVALQGELNESETRCGVRPPNLSDMSVFKLCFSQTSQSMNGIISLGFKLQKRFASNFYSYDRDSENSVVYCKIVNMSPPLSSKLLSSNV